MKTVPISSLHEPDYNPRSIKPAALARLANSIQAHTAALEGWDPADGLRMVTTITVNRNGSRVVGGNQRLKALLSLGQDWIHADDITWLDLEPGSIREKTLNIALNSDDIKGDWDWDKLDDMLRDIKSDGMDLGFTALAESTLETIGDNGEWEIPPPALEVAAPALGAGKQSAGGKKKSSEPSAAGKDKVTVTYTLTHEQAAVVRAALDHHGGTTNGESKGAGLAGICGEMADQWATLGS